MNKLSRKDIAMLEVLAATEESKGKLAEYIQQQGKAAKAYKAFREAVVNGVEVEKVVKPAKPKRKFKAGDKVRVLDTENPIVPLGLGVGDVTEVLKYILGGVVVVKTPRQAGYAFRESSLELVEEKSPNELRAEIIEKAKKVLEMWKRNSFAGLDDYQNSELGFPYKHWSLVAEFVINPEKRTVVALLKGHETLRLATKSIAKCAHDDVFNSHISKAIALGRALGKDVSEFENAVQPNFEVGQTARLMPRYEGRESEIQIIKVDEDKLWFVNEFGVEMYMDTGVNVVEIIDDTNAQYKEGVE